MYPFLADKKQHRYKPNSSFDDIVNLYRFDRELRVLIFSTIEKIEIAVRAQISNHFAVDTKDPFWYTDVKYFSSPADHKSFLNNTSSNIKRSTDIFLKHFYDTYNNAYPPIWVVLEILSMGQLSILYNITKRSSARKAAADYFGIKEPVLANWLHALVYVRNICAHHARLWNKQLSIQIKNPKTINRPWLSSGDITKRKIYEILAIIACFLDTITPTNTFRNKLKNLLAKYPNIDVTAMGFPKDWKNDPFWSGVSNPFSA
jgi:abortive infection bacteriophage resistance protein